jgi:hypothetical protein
MSFYRVDRDLDHCMYAAFDDMDIVEKMEDFDIEGFGKPLKFKWTAPVLSFMEGDSGATTQPDLSQWCGYDLIVSDHAKSRLDALIGDSVEYYPLICDTGSYLFANPIRQLDSAIVDIEQTRSIYYNDGSFDRIEKLVLKNDQEPSAPALFTLAIDGGTTLYCTEAFRQSVEQHGLKGLRFTAIDSE